MERNDELMVAGNNVVADLAPEDLVVKKEPGVFKNIATGIGIAAGGALACYGLYELGKKGVKFFKKLMEKKRENAEHPEYRYEKMDDVEEAEKEIKDTLAKAKFRHKKEKNPMGFQYKG